MNLERSIKNLKKSLKAMLKLNKTDRDTAERWEKKVDYAFYEGSIVTLENILEYLNEIK
jgi:hypothetical protein